MYALCQIVDTLWDHGKPYTMYCFGMRDAYPQGMLLYYVSFTYSFAHGGCATMRKPHRSNMKFRLIFPHFGTTIIFDFFDLYLACVQCEYALGFVFACCIFLILSLMFMLCPSGFDWCLVVLEASGSIISLRYSK